MSEVNIRESTLNDADGIAHLASQMGDRSFTVEMMIDKVKGFVESDHEVIFVAEKDDKLLGCVSIYANWELLTGMQARIDIIAVDESARGMGVGRLLMERAEEWAKQHGSETMKLASNTKRIEPHKFYEKIGYTKTREQAAFKKVL